MIYDDRINWCEQESEHFIFKYPRNTVIEKDIEDIIEKREAAHNMISNLLGIKKIPKKHVLYLSPDRDFCLIHNMLAQAAIPHQFFASLVYDEKFPFHTEKFAYGHEITHLLVYLWDYEMYHLEFLEEGLATYLDQSGVNCHLRYLQKLEKRFGRTSIDFSLKVRPHPRVTDYEKAGSFVQFLIEKYGIAPFKQLYTSIVLTRRNGIFYHEENVLPENFLECSVEKNYNRSISDIQKAWLSCLGIQL